MKDDHTTHHDAIVRDLLRLGTFLHREGDRIAAEFGLTQQQAVVLHEVVRRGEATQTELIADLLLKKSNMSKIIKKLRELGLVQLLDEPGDGRKAPLSPTQAGKRTDARCMERFHDWNEKWLEPLGPGEAISARNALERLALLLGNEE